MNTNRAQYISRRFPAIKTLDEFDFEFALGE